MRHQFSAVLRVCAPAAAGLLILASAARAGETFTATAVVTGPAGGKATAPVTFVVERFATDAERDALFAALRTGGTPAAHELLSGCDNFGSVQIGGHTTPIKYANQRSLGSGRLITIVTAEPVLFLGAGLPEAKPKAEYQLALAVFEANAAGTGQGELTPAAKVRVDDKDAIVTEDYGAEVIRLTNVVKK